MTVAELIKQLSDCDPNAIVLMCSRAPLAFVDNGDFKNVEHTEQGWYEPDWSSIPFASDAEKREYELDHLEEHAVCLWGGR